ncbi:hypothetical protein GS489_07960 [Rhodococcus hoagii]|nr:hypothetical protein [Prescottella equi]
MSFERHLQVQLDRLGRDDRDLDDDTTDHDYDPPRRRGVRAVSNLAIDQIERAPHLCGRAQHRHRPQPGPHSSPNIRSSPAHPGNPSTSRSSAPSASGSTSERPWTTDSVAEQLANQSGAFPWNGPVGNGFTVAEYQNRFREMAREHLFTWRQLGLITEEG